MDLTMPTREGVDVSRFFDQDAFSDVTLQFGSYQVKCHKLVLCARSDYFMKLCGPDSRFAEADQQLIQLKDDDPIALQAMLRYLYTADYEENPAVFNRDPLFHFKVSVVADKYLLVDLRTRAQQQFERLVTSTEDARQILAIVTLLNNEYQDDAKLSRLVITLTKKHLPALLQIDEFRTILMNSPKLAMGVIDGLAFASTVAQSSMKRCPRWD